MLVCSDDGSLCLSKQIALEFSTYIVISQTNSLKLMVPSPSWSMTLTISFSSSSCGFQPNVLITASNSSAPMDPPPSRSKKEKMSRYSLSLSGDSCSIALIVPGIIYWIVNSDDITSYTDTGQLVTVSLIIKAYYWIQTAQSQYLPVCPANPCQSHHHPPTLSSSGSGLEISLSFPS